MGLVARNSLKGYTYQQSVFILFFSIMDTERNISKIEIEALDTKNFDDMYFDSLSNGEQARSSYPIHQAKNYPNISIEDIAFYHQSIYHRYNIH